MSYDTPDWWQAVGSEVVGHGPCARCGADPARGFASISDADGERWYCHDDDADCYTTA
jgi:hypothetical protein